MKERIRFAQVPPMLFKGLNDTENYFKTTGFDLKLLELIKYRVSQINGCAFCLEMHYKEADHMGETQQRLHALPAWRESPFYEDKERAALAFAEALTNINHDDVDNEIYAALAKHYSIEEISILTVAITQINAWNRINITFRTIPGNYQVGQYG